MNNIIEGLQLEGGGGGGGKGGGGGGGGGGGFTPLGPLLDFTPRPIIHHFSYKIF